MVIVVVIVTVIIKVIVIVTKMSNRVGNSTRTGNSSTYTSIVVIIECSPHKKLHSASFQKGMGSLLCLVLAGFFLLLTMELKFILWLAAHGVRFVLLWFSVSV